MLNLGCFGSLATSRKNKTLRENTSGRDVSCKDSDSIAPKRTSVKKQFWQGAFQFGGKNGVSWANVRE